MAFPPQFPIPKETLLASVVEVLKHQGCAREIAILVAASADLDRVDHDNWDGGIDDWELALGLDIRLHSSLSEEERTASAKLILEIAQDFLLSHRRDRLVDVSIVVRPITNDAWRDDANAWLSGAGLTNQGRVRSDNIASRQYKGLLFRSQAEINLFQALTSAGVTFAPLPVFVRGGTTYARLEPDFVIVKDGVIMVVEVDGDTYHRETPAEAHARLQPLDHEGAKVERVRADECASPELAKECATRLLRILQKRIAQL